MTRIKTQISNPRLYLINSLRLRYFQSGKRSFTYLTISSDSKDIAAKNCFDGFLMKSYQVVLKQVSACGTNIIEILLNSTLLYRLYPSMRSKFFNNRFNQFSLKNVKIDFCPILVSTNFAKNKLE